MKETVAAYKPRPTLSIDAKMLPEVTKWRVGKKYHLMLEVEQTEISQSEYEEGNPVRARFTILSAKHITGPEPDEMKEKIKEKASRYEKS